MVIIQSEFIHVQRVFSMLSRGDALENKAVRQGVIRERSSWEKG